MDVIANRLKEFRALACKMVPELSGAIFYTLVQPDRWPRPSGTLAYSIRGRHLALRDYLRSQGEWRGWGAGTIIFCELQESLEDFLGLATHELAHLLPVSVMTDDVEPTATERNAQEAMLAAWCAVEDPSPKLQAVPWLSHDAAFIRNCLHLIERARRCGVDLPLPAVNFAGEHYELSGAWKYRRELADEPRRMLGRTFAEIKSVEPPAPFRKLFAADTAAWHHSQSLTPKK